MKSSVSERTVEYFMAVRETARVVPTEPQLMEDWKETDCKVRLGEDVGSAVAARPTLAGATVSAQPKTPLHLTRADSSTVPLLIDPYRLTVETYRYLMAFSTL